MDNKDNRKKREEKSLPADMRADAEINTDPNGMWTGVSTDDADEDVIQDVDDL